MPGFKLVITLRADFYRDAISHHAFAKALETGVFNVSSMMPQELHQAIALPTKNCGVTLEGGLTERILEDVGKKPDTPGDGFEKKPKPDKLPLLEFALQQLWEQAKQQGTRQLTHQVYDEIGGVENALGQYAEAVYLWKLQVEEQLRLERVFLELVRPGERTGTEDTRRLATRGEMGDNWDLATRLNEEDVRLVVIGYDRETGEETVEVVHEALIGSWGRLKVWIEDNRPFLTWRERLRVGMRQWQASGEDEGALLRGALLVEAEGFLRGRSQDIGKLERVYIEKGLELRQREWRERRRLQQQVIGGLIFGLAVALSLAGMATWQWRRSERLRLTAESEGLALSALQQFESGGGEIEALISAMEAGQKLRTLVKSGEISEDYPTNRPLSVLQTILSNIREKNQFIADFYEVTTVSMSQDGKLVTTGGRKDGAVRIWNTSGQLITEWETHNNELYKVSFSPNGKVVATWGDNGNSSEHSVSLWDISGENIAELQVNKKEFSASTTHYFSFSPDGKMIATAFWNHVRLWNMSGEEIAKFHSGNVTGKIVSLSFSSDSQKLVTGSAGGSVEIWDVKEQKRITAFQAYSTPVNRVTFSPNGQQILTIGFDRVQATGMRNDKAAVRLWDVSGKLISQHVYDNSQALADAIFSPDGNNIVVVGSSGLIQIFEFLGKRSERLYGQKIGVNSVTFTPNSKQIVTAGRDGSIRLWNVSKKQVTQLVGQKSIASLQFSQNGKQVITTSNKRARVWNISGKLIVDFPINSDNSSIGFVRPTPNGHHFLTVGKKGAVLYDLSGKVIAQLKVNFKNHEAILTDFMGIYNDDINFSSSEDGHCIATVGSIIASSNTRLWNFRQHKIVKLKSPNDSFVNQSLQVDISHDCQYILNIGLFDRIVRIWDKSGQIISQLDGSIYLSEEPKEISGIGVILATKTSMIMEILKDSPAMKSGLKARDIIIEVNGKYVGNMKTDEITGLLNGDPGTQVNLTISRDWESLDLSLTREKVKLPSLRNTYSHAKFSPDSKYVATWIFEGRSFDLWNLSGEKIAELKGHQKGVVDLYFSPDSNLIATSDKNNLVRVWTRLGELITELKFTQLPFGIKFSPDSKIIAAIEGNKVSLWNLSGKRIYQFTNPHAKEYTWLSFSPDGQYLAASSEYKTINATGHGRISIWYIAGLDGLLAQGCNWLKDYLSIHPETKEKLTVCQDQSILGEAEKALERERDIEKSVINFHTQLGKDLVMVGDIDGAVANLRKALALDPNLNLDSKAQAQLLVDRILFEGGMLLARGGNIEQAISAYAEAQKLNPTIRIPANAWNTLCWNGSLRGHAAEVINYCEKAVELEPENGHWQDSRGLARVLTGNTEGAIEDFQAFIDRIDNTEPQTDADKVKFNKWKQQRQGWIDALRAGENPFTEEVLKSLLSE